MGCRRSWEGLGWLGSGSSFGPGCPVGGAEHLALLLWLLPQRSPSATRKGKDGTAGPDAVLLKRQQQQKENCHNPCYSVISKKLVVKHLTACLQLGGLDLPDGEPPFQSFASCGPNGMDMPAKVSISPVLKMLPSSRRVTLQSRNETHMTVHPRGKWERHCVLSSDI